MSRVEAQELREEANEKRRVDHDALSKESKDINQSRAPVAAAKAKGKDKVKAKPKGKVMAKGKTMAKGKAKKYR